MIEENDIEEINEPEEIAEEESEPEVIEEATEVVVESGSIVTESYDPLVGRLKSRELVTEMETSYLDYAMSVIVSRALPDVRDGLKPVHRRVLYAMYETGLRHNVKYRKSAKVVGEVMGNYHPHGDTAIYDTLVRMAQDFSMRYPMVDGQGNFGSMDGDSAAAMRYTECRMSPISEEMVLDIDKDTVNWADNYDGSTQEPVVLPSRVPNLLLNGTVGIAVGMATNIPPHNLVELCDGVSALIDNPEATVEDLMEHVKGPDFPTGGIIYSNEDIKTTYATGHGRIMMRGKAEIEETKRGFRIIVTEIPYQVNKSTLIEKIADLVKEKRIEGISDLRDESDRNGVRVVVELKNSAYPKKVLNRLYELTSLQTAFHVNMLALTPDLEPMVMTLKDVLGHFIEHRKEVIERRTRFDLRKAEDRAHILEGLRIALDHIDEVINTIRASANREDAKTNLIAKFSLSDKQADAILEMRLSALAALERKKIEDEYNALLDRIAYLKDLLEHPEKILLLIKTDLKEVCDKYGDKRRTEIVPHALGEFRAEDVIPDEQVIVALSRGNYIKRQEIDTYRRQTRGGVGVIGMTTKEEDIVDHLVCAKTHDDIFFFTNKGRVFKSKVYELPATSRQSKGTPVVNIIQIMQEEKVTAILTIPKGENSNKYFIMGTDLGQIKKTEIEKYDNIRKTGIIAMGLKDKDELKWVKTSCGNDVIVEVSEKGQAICYNENDVRPMGRSASGVTGMRLRAGDRVMSMDVVPDITWPEEGKKVTIEPDMLIVLENGFGKRTMMRHFHIQKRGGMGIRAANCTPKTGKVIGMHIVYEDLGDVVLASRKGQFIRMELKKIKRLGRDTQGVTLMRLREGDKVSSVALILPDSTAEDGDNSQQSLLEKVDEDNAETVATPKFIAKADAAPKKVAPKPAAQEKAPEKTLAPKAKPEISATVKKDVQKFADMAVKELAKEKKADIKEKSTTVNSYSKPNLNVKFYNKNVIIDKDDQEK
jgi:DNA gyrase subunit A